jgi:hypothetical protein
MQSALALALGLLVVGLGLFGAAAATPFAFPAAFQDGGQTTNPAALFVMLSISCVFTIFAAWIVARLVPDHRTGHGLMLSAMGVSVAIGVSAVRWATAPYWYHILSWALMPLCGYIGAAAWERTLRRQSAATLPRANSGPANGSRR